MCPANDTPTWDGFEEADALIGPPVVMIFPASSLKVSLSSVFLVDMNIPAEKSTSSGCVSQRIAARVFISSIILWAAFIAASPVDIAVLLPAVSPVQPIESVSPTVGVTSSVSIPSISAACIATETLVPPMSTDPVIRLIVPFVFTTIVAED